MTANSAILAALASAEAGLAAAASALAGVRALVQQESEAPAKHDELLGLPQVKALYHVGRAAVLAAIDRGDLRASRGPRQAILVSSTDVETWLRSRPVAPRKHDHEPANDDDAWAAAAAAEVARIVSTGVSRVR